MDDVSASSGAQPAPPEVGVQEGVPASKAQRDALRDAARQYVRRRGLAGPLPLEELTAHAAAVLNEAGLNEAFLRFALVVLNNEVWRDVLAGIPFERRLLLLPQCLRRRDVCVAEVDELGLLCKRCGACMICDLQAQAEAMGYVVLVAEGTVAVTRLVETGQVEGIVGVSCLSMLERVFPHIHAAAVPAVAIPLLRDGCEDTDVDVDWITDALYRSGDAKAAGVDIVRLRERVNGWFAPRELRRTLGSPRGHVERIGRQWLALAGKRWRPLLTVCCHQAFQDDPRGPVPDRLRDVAMGVECFHKASLVHDDIEDGDAVRYGRPTLHAEHGVPVALNVGDWLLGEGYRLLAESDFGPEVRAEMLAVAARAHRALCLGQGDELAWARDRRVLTVPEVLEIFRLKTAPAFEVALRLGALCASACHCTMAALSSYSEHLGVAYQIRDDLEDLGAGGQEALTARPSVLLAAACEWATGPQRRRLENLWCGLADADPGELRSTLDALGAVPAARRLLAEHKAAALEALRPLDNADLKCLLRRVLGRIFHRIDTADWCGDDQTRASAGGDERGEIAR